MQLKNKNMKKRIMALGLATALATIPTVAQVPGVGNSIIAEAATASVSTLAELKSAISKNSSCTITLKNSINLTESILIEKGKDITIVNTDESNVLYTKSDLKWLFKVEGTLRLGSSERTENARVVLRGGDANSGLVTKAIICVNGNLIINRAHLYRSNSCGVLISDGHMTMNKKADKCTGNESTINGIIPTKNEYGVVAVTNKSDFTMNGGYIGTENSPNAIGGVTVRTTGTFTMNGGSIQSCQKGAGDLGIGETEWGTKLITSPVGGGVFNQGIFVMNGGTIKANTSSCGGGVYNSGTMTMKSGSIQNNSITSSSASRKGSGIYNVGTLQISGDCEVTTETDNRNEVVLDGKGKIEVVGPLTKKPALEVNLPNLEVNTVIATCPGGLQASNIVDNIAVTNKGDFVIVDDGTTLKLSKKYNVDYCLDGTDNSRTGKVEKLYGESLVVPSEEDILSMLKEENKENRGYYLDPNGLIEVGTSNYYAYGTSISVNRSMTLMAKWLPKKFNVSYNLNGADGEVPETINTQFDKGVLVSAKSPIRQGYDFVGWSTSPDGSSEVYAPGKHIEHVFDEDVMFYAVWKAKPIIISYDSNGGSTITQTEGDYEKTPSVTDEVPWREGYKFEGWIDEKGNVQAAGNKISESTTLKASWKAITYTIKYTTGEGSKIKDSEGTYSNHPVVTSEIPVREGYVFDGWVDETNKSVAAGEIMNKDVVLTAKWTVAPVTITYDTVGGSEIAPSVGNKKTGVLVTLEKPEKDGYIFEGWYDAADNKVNASHKYVSDVVLTAKWVTMLEWDVKISKASASGMNNLYALNSNISYKKFKKPLSITVSAARKTNLGKTKATISYQLVKKGKSPVDSKWKLAKNGVIKVESAMDSYIVIMVVADGVSKKYITSGFSVDSKAPTISGVKNKGCYKKAVKIKVSDSGSGIKSIKLNGKSVKSGKVVKKKGRYTLVATDKYGNKKTIVFTLEKNVK